MRVASDSGVSGRGNCRLRVCARSWFSLIVSCVPATETLSANTPLLRAVGGRVPDPLQSPNSSTSSTRSWPLLPSGRMSPSVALRAAASAATNDPTSLAIRCTSGSAFSRFRTAHTGSRSGQLWVYRSDRTSSDIDWVTGLDSKFI